MPLSLRLEFPRDSGFPASGESPESFPLDPRLLALRQELRFLDPCQTRELCRSPHGLARSGREEGSRSLILARSASTAPLLLWRVGIERVAGGCDEEVTSSARPPKEAECGLNDHSVPVLIDAKNSCLATWSEGIVAGGLNIGRVCGGLRG